MSQMVSNEKAITALPSEFVGHTGRGASTITPPAELTQHSSLNDILIFARKENASDVHLSAQKPVIFRQYTRLKNITTDIFGADRIESLIKAALPPDTFKKIEDSGDGEHVHTIAGYGRFRMTLMKQSNGWDLTVRLIPMDIPKFEVTGMPASCANLTKWAQGLVLVTGPAGCGKTTSLAALIEMINQTRNDHIITIEHPIEIVYEPKQSQITQREINLHTLSQDKALRAALREDPDILVVSELRDLKTVQLAISASETGHLVFGTMNTVNAAQTISRVIDSFPSEEQSIIRNMISESLRGVICQQLIPKKDGTGLVAAFEVLIVNSSVSNLIRKGDMNQITNAITTGKAAGMVLMDHSLENLARRQIISKQEACERATNAATMMQTLVSYA
jgi:twitching motility protein PilT